ncbi:MAG: SpoIID/LytB domain-containing protein [Acidimicrobiales bacterium]
MTPALAMHRFRTVVAGLAAFALVCFAAAPAGAAQGDGASSDAMPAERSSTSDLAPGDPATITFTGGGWGHGAGMSQYGAYGRAAAGKNYKAILRFYYQNTVVRQSDYAGNVAVGLGTSSAVTFTPRGRAELRLNNTVKAVARNGQSVRVARSGSGWSLKINGAEQCAAGSCGGGSFALTYADGTIIDVAGFGSYDHGKIKLVPTAPGSSSLWVVVASLTMDEYLYGLAEVPSSWPAEALKTQAVAGRSFAQHNIEARRASSSWTKPFDLSATTGDQVYAGRAKSAGSYSEFWRAAVDDTSGEISTFEGEPIQAFYSSSHGGYSENSEYVFYERLDYIRARPDPFDGHQNAFHEWTRTYSIAELSRWLGAYSSSNVGTLRSIEITGNIGVSGRVNRATAVLIGSAGTKRITGNELRWRINAGAGSSLDRQLLSTKFEVGSTKAPDEAPIGKFKVTDVVDSGPNAHISLRGWALDPDTSASIRVYLTDNGRWSGGQVANDLRPGIDNQYGLGPKHGFEFDHDLSPGVHRVCVVARNHPDNTPVELGCRTVRVGNSPSGTIADVSSRVEPGLPYRPAVVSVTGTADDPDTPGAIDVVVALGNETTTATTSNGTFATTFSAPPGPAQACATVVDDSGLRPDADLGCVNHQVVDRSPVGKFNVTFPGPGQIRLHGWALDPDSTASIDVVLTIDGQTAAERTADDARPSIATKYGRGPAHGYDLDATVAPGRYRFCVLAIDATDTSATPVEIGCRNKTVA